jgi:glutamine synthetase
MKDWAIEKGATHYAHVFLSADRLTAEKHDSFLSPDGKGGAIAEFTGKQLIQGEPDASSFPSGGIRATFEARGYTAWDVTSPAYILENPNGTTLCIPTAFVSWTGEALDKKTPLLRSMQALNKQAQRMLKLFGHKDGAMCLSPPRPRAGILPDRPQLLLRPPRPAQLRPHAVRRQAAQGPGVRGPVLRRHPRARAGLHARTERELFKLGVPVKTRHNEVAPASTRSPRSTKRQRRHRPPAAGHAHAQARGAEVRHGLPAAREALRRHQRLGQARELVAGQRTQGNLLEPGDTPHDNMQFLVFCAAVIRAVHKHSGCCARRRHAGNDHRLGANEAPPAIISIFLGDQLTDVFEQIKKGGAEEVASRRHADVGVDTLPPLPKDAGDRNRTSPFAFTGNKFEFRAVGSSQSIAGPLVA